MSTQATETGRVMRSGTQRVMRTLRQGVRNILLGWLAFALLGAVVTELMGWYLTRSLPTGPTHVAAVTIALLLGYAAAVTVAFRALLHSLVESVEWVGSELKRLAGRVFHEADTVTPPAAARQAGLAVAASGRAATWSADGFSDGVIGGLVDDSAPARPRIRGRRFSLTAARWGVRKGSRSTRFVLPTGPWSTISIETCIPAWSDWYARLSQSHLVVRYDLRGTGLSDRAPVDFRLEAQLRDLEAVHDRLGLTTAALLAVQHAGPIAIAYAARHPQRVPHLLLWCTYARVADYFAAPQSHTRHDFMDADWGLFTETMAPCPAGMGAGRPGARGGAAGEYQSHAAAARDLRCRHSHDRRRRGSAACTGPHAGVPAAAGAISRCHPEAPPALWTSC